MEKLHHELIAMHIDAYGDKNNKAADKAHNAGKHTVAAQCVEVCGAAREAAVAWATYGEYPAITGALRALADDAHVIRDLDAVHDEIQAAVKAFADACAEAARLRGDAYRAASDRYFKNRDAGDAYAVNQARRREEAAADADEIRLKGDAAATLITVISGAWSRRADSMIDAVRARVANEMALAESAQPMGQAELPFEPDPVGEALGDTEEPGAEEAEAMAAAGATKPRRAKKQSTDAT